MLPELLTREELKEKLNVNDLYSYERRWNYIRSHGWFILHKKQAEILAKFCKDKKVLELCAGTGYLAAQLRKLGVKDYTAVDNYSSHTKKGEVNHGVTDRNALSMTIAKYDIIVLTWPSYDSTLAHTIIKRMRKDQVLIYQGEDFGGCCADDKFFNYLYKPEKFMTLSLLERQLNHEHLRWSGIHDDFKVVKKLVNR